MSAIVEALKSRMYKAPFDEVHPYLVTVKSHDGVDVEHGRFSNFPCAARTVVFLGRNANATVHDTINNSRHEFSFCNLYLTRHRHEL